MASNNAKLKVVQNICHFKHQSKCRLTIFSYKLICQDLVPKFPTSSISVIAYRQEKTNLLKVDDLCSLSVGGEILCALTCTLCSTSFRTALYNHDDFESLKSWALAFSKNG